MDFVVITFSLSSLIWAIWVIVSINSMKRSLEKIEDHSRRHLNLVQSNAEGPSRLPLRDVPVDKYTSREGILQQREQAIAAVETAKSNRPDRLN